MQWGHKNSSWNKRVKDSDFRFLDSNIHKENIWKLSYLLIGFPSAIFPSQFMNILTYEALRIIFIRNCLIYEDAIFMWGKMRIRRRHVFLFRMRMMDFRLEAERKMSGEATNWSSLRSYSGSLLTPPSTFFCELNLMVSGPITESFVFLDL